MSSGKNLCAIGLSSLRSCRVVICLFPICASAFEGASRELAAAEEEESPVSRSGLSADKWSDVEQSVDSALRWLAARQNRDGSFDGTPDNEPGITGLCVLAFLSRGHTLGEGPYEESIRRAVEFIMKSQRRDGMLARTPHNHRSVYSHAIASLALTEVYRTSNPDHPYYDPIRSLIERSIDFAAKRLPRHKTIRDDRGGWRYLAGKDRSDSDLSITSWHVLFLQSAVDAKFLVDAHLLDEAQAYVRRTYDRTRGTFRYEIHTDNPPINHTRAMAGAGALALSMAGEGGTQRVQNAARFILDRPFSQIDHPVIGEEYQCYSAFYCSQAMYRLGGKSWEAFYPALAATLTRAQSVDGRWRSQSGKDLRFGDAYVTALCILALTPPMEKLPVFKR